MMQNTNAEVQRLQAKLQGLGQRRHQTRQPTTLLSPDDVTAPGRPSAPQVSAVQANRTQPPQIVSLPFGTRSNRRSQLQALEATVLSRRTNLDSAVGPKRSPTVSPKVQPPKAQATKAQATKAPPALHPALHPVSTADAMQLARTLRRRQRSMNSRKPGFQTGSVYLLRFGKRLSHSLRYPLSQLSRISRGGTSRGVARTAAQSPKQPKQPEALSDITLQDAALWIAASAAVRVGLDLLLITYASLWWPVVTLIVAPAAIALYRTVVSPKAGFVLGRQLLLIMIGLLLGGQML